MKANEPGGCCAETDGLQTCSVKNQELEHILLSYGIVPLGSISALLSIIFHHRGVSFKILHRANKKVEFSILRLLCCTAVQNQ